MPVTPGHNDAPRGVVCALSALSASAPEHLLGPHGKSEERQLIDAQNSHEDVLCAAAPQSALRRLPLAQPPALK